MKKLLLLIVFSISLTNTIFAQNIVADFVDKNKYEGSRFYGDINFWRNYDLSNVSFGTLFTLYKRRIIDKGEYASYLMSLSRNQKICEIYKDSMFNIKRDLELSEWAIRACLPRHDLKIFYANLLYTIPANERIGSLDDYLMEQHQRANAPKNILTLIFGE